MEHAPGLLGRHKGGKGRGVGMPLRRKRPESVGLAVGVMLIGLTSGAGAPCPSAGEEGALPRLLLRRVAPAALGSCRNARMLLGSHESASLKRQLIAELG